MFPKNVLTFLLVASLELFLQITSSLLMMNILQIFYLNYMWKQHVEEGFLCVSFYLGIHCFCQFLAGSFRIIFFISISPSFAEEEFRILPSSTPPRCFWRVILTGLYFFLALFSKYFHGLFFWFSWSHKVLSKLFSKQTYVHIMPLQQICLLPQHFFGLLHRAFEGC